MGAPFRVSSKADFLVGPSFVQLKGACCFPRRPEALPDGKPRAGLRSPLSRASASSSTLFLFHLTFQKVRQCGLLPVAVVLFPVHKEGRGPVYPASNPTFKIGLYAGSKSAFLDITFELVDVQAKRFGIGDQVFRAQVLLVLVQRVVHFPEFMLQPRGFGRQRRVLRVRVRVRQRKVSEHKFQISAQSLLRGFNQGVSLATIAALVVAVFYQLYGGGAGPLDVVVAAHCGR